MEKNLCSWVFVDFSQNGECPEEWYLVNYKKQVVYDPGRDRFERAKHIQNSIEKYDH